MLKSAPKFPEKNISKNMNLKMFGGSTLPFLLTCLTFLDVTSLRSVCKEKVNEPAIFLLIFMRRAEDFGKGGLQPNILEREGPERVTVLRHTFSNMKYLQELPTK